MRLGGAGSIVSAKHSGPHQRLKLEINEFRASLGYRQEVSKAKERNGDIKLHSELTRRQRGQRGDDHWQEAAAEPAHPPDCQLSWEPEAAAGAPC